MLVICKYIMLSVDCVCHAKMSDWRLKNIRRAGFQRKFSPVSQTAFRIRYAPKTAKIAPTR